MKKLIAVLVAAAFAGTAFQAIAQAQPSAPERSATTATTPDKAQGKKRYKPAKGKKKAKAKGKPKAEPKN